MELEWASIECCGRRGNEHPAVQIAGFYRDDTTGGAWTFMGVGFDHEGHHAPGVHRGTGLFWLDGDERRDEGASWSPGLRRKVHLRCTVCDVDVHARGEVVELVLSGVMDARGEAVPGPYSWPLPRRWVWVPVLAVELAGGLRLT